MHELLTGVRHVVEADFCGQIGDGRQVAQIEIDRLDTGLEGLLPQAAVLEAQHAVADARMREQEVGLHRGRILRLHSRRRRALRQCAFRLCPLALHRSGSAGCLAGLGLLASCGLFGARRCFDFVRRRW